MRERCFAVLADRVRGARMLDLFAGTGAVGIEALSRGAASAVFVEAHRQAAALIRANLEALGVDDVRTTVMIGSARRSVDRLSDRRRTFDLIWADPPFECWQDGLEALVAAVVSGIAEPGATLCLECPVRATIDTRLPGELVVVRDLRGGASRVVMLRTRSVD
jgi:16S rRNA (guanine(966)-N(2))-methyltransferase RsmD